MKNATLSTMNWDQCQFLCKTLELTFGTKLKKLAGNWPKKAYSPNTLNVPNFRPKQKGMVTTPSDDTFINRKQAGRVGKE